MKRLVYDVPRWHVFLHRDARLLDPHHLDDTPRRRLEDELFDRLYSGEGDLLPEGDRDALAKWAEQLHGACGQAPSFARLAGACRGDAAAAAAGVEALLDELSSDLPDEPGAAPPSPPPSDLAQLRRQVLRGCERAQRAIDELRETVDGLSGVRFGPLPGKGAGSGGERLPAGAIRSLSRRLQRDSRLRRIALLAGRLKRIAATKRRQRVRHGADEIADIEQGAELSRLLPSELVKLSHPLARRLVHRSLLERECLQYQLRGAETLGRGPMVLVLDKSSSMDGQADIWATAVALALAAQAGSERRTFALLCFNYTVIHESVVLPGEALPEEALLVGCSGGTDIPNALSRALDLIEGQPASALGMADVVLVTDGGDVDNGRAAPLRERARKASASILGFGIGVAKQDLEPWVDEAQVITDLSGLEDPAATALFAH